MDKKFLFYGIAGWTLEVCWTGLGSLWQGDLTLVSRTYLWMFPIYGLAILLEPIHDYIEDLPWYIRGFIWAAAIIMIEYFTGWLLQSIIGQCPWDYSDATPYHIQGFIRLDYIPAWFLVGLIFEKLHRVLDRFLLH